MGRRIGACLILVIASSSCLYAAAGTEFGFERGEHPFFLPVRFGTQVYDFMLDTGASGTIFDASFRPQLGEPRGNVGASTSDSPILLQIFAAPRAFVGPFNLADCNEVATIDLHSLTPVLGRTIHGLLGMDLLKKHVLQIDFDRGRIAFLDGAPKEQQDWGQEFSMSYDSLGRPQVKAAIQGGPEIEFVIDTGYGGGGSLEKGLFDEVVSSGNLKTNEVLNATATGITKFRQARVDRLNVGPFEYRGLILNTGNGNILGADFLSRHIVTFDFPNGRLYLMKGKDFADPFETDMSGLSLVRSEGRTLVYDVQDGRPAAKAGIKTNDVVLKLQGRDANTCKMWQIDQLLRSGDGKEITMTIQRGSEIKDMAILLERQI
jgi:predicted aspartyl protease